jgi:haloacetate dehalogenase
VISGFEETRVVVGEASYFVAHGGAGSPVLLLHVFPETHVCWQHTAPRLSAACRVIAADLRGYGASRAPAGGPRGEGYSKREMAGELVELMAALGHQRFAVVGHDRGARVAFRLALDHPECVTRAAGSSPRPQLQRPAGEGKRSWSLHWSVPFTRARPSAGQALTFDGLACRRNDSPTGWQVGRVHAAA